MSSLVRRERGAGRGKEPGREGGGLAGPLDIGPWLGSGAPEDFWGSSGVGFSVSKLIDPYSSVVERQELEVTVELHACVEVVDPLHEQQVLVAHQALLLLQQLVGERGGVGGVALGGRG